MTFQGLGSTDSAGARLIDVCLDHGVSLFDTADVILPARRMILGEAIKVSATAYYLHCDILMGEGLNDLLLTPASLEVEGALKRLNRDDRLPQLHGQDYNTGRGDASRR